MREREGRRSVESCTIFGGMNAPAYVKRMAGTKGIMSGKEEAEKGD